MKNSLKAFILGGMLFSQGLTSPFMIRSLDVKGNQRVENQVILDYFPSKKDRVYTQKELDDFVKTLSDTGLFKEVKIALKGQILMVEVEENLFINQVVFEGQKEVSNEDLKSVISLKPRQVFTSGRVREAEQAILNVYRTKGRYGTKVKTSIIKRPYGRVDVVFSLVEGPKAYIRSIVFLGNKTFSSSTLSKVISSREERWYRLFSPPEEIYNPERIKYDEELLRQFYIKKGYADVQILSSHGEFSVEDHHFVLTYALSEGKRYSFGSYEFSSEHPLISAQLIHRAVPWKEGDWFDGALLQATCDKMTTSLNEKGFSFLEVIPMTTKKDQKLIIKFVIKDTPPRYIEKLLVTGHLGTDEHVVRRELTFAEGDALSSFQITESEKKLQSLDFFETVEISESSGSSEQKRQVTVRVKEKSTGDIQLGGGFSTLEGPIGRVGYSERNFLGKGYGINLSSQIGRRNLDVDFGTSVPHFMGRKVTVGNTLFIWRYRGDTRRTFSKEGGYRREGGGTSVFANYSIIRSLYQGWSYKICREKFYLRHPDMSPYLQTNVTGLLPGQDETQASRHHQRARWISSLGHDLMYNRVNRLGGEATSGWFAKLSNEWAGLGGSVRYLSNTLSGSYYLPFDEDSQYMLRAEGRYGFIHRLGYMRFMDQSFLGGFNFPGFSMSGIGPRDEKTRDALGGKQHYTASLKFSFPLGLPKELPIKGILYVQTGSLWQSMFHGNNIASQKFKNRLSVGGGLICTLPFVGKMGLILSKALMKHPMDECEVPMIIWGKDF